MKIWKPIVFAIVALALNSCSNIFYYQLYTTESKNLISEGSTLVFEDPNCKVTYNLWSEGGDAGFKLYNKTDQYLYLNLEDCFFVLNGQANNYYQNRIFTTSSSKGITSTNAASHGSSDVASILIQGVNSFGYQQQNSIARSSYGNFYLSSGTSFSHGYSISNNEEKVICIPPKTFKNISEYSISQAIYRNCDLFLYPGSRDNNKMTFTETSSPVVFSNRIAYSIGKDGQPVKVENNFYVTEIANYSQKEVINLEYESFCGEKGHSPKKFFKQVSPSKYYIGYKKVGTHWKH